MIHYSWLEPKLPTTKPKRLAAASPRERILAAAREVVAESGWQDAQIALIAHRAEVATGSVYRHFDSKAHLYAQVLAMVSEREVAVIAAIADSGGAATQRLVDAIFMFSLRALRGRRLAYALIAEPCEPEIDRARLVYRAALADQIARLIREGVAVMGPDLLIEADSVRVALVGPLSPEATPQGAAARTMARSIASLAARLVFRRSAPKLALVSKGLR